MPVAQPAGMQFNPWICEGLVCNVYRHCIGLAMSPQAAYNTPHDNLDVGTGLQLQESKDLAYLVDLASTRTAT